MVTIVGERIRRVHPVERFVRAAIGMDGDASIGLHHDQPHGFRQVSIEATAIVDGAAGNDKAHGERR